MISDDSDANGETTLTDTQRLEALAEDIGQWEWEAAWLVEALQLAMGDDRAHAAFEKSGFVSSVAVGAILERCRQRLRDGRWDYEWWKSRLEDRPDAEPIHAPRAARYEVDDDELDALIEGATPEQLANHLRNANRALTIGMRLAVSRADQRDRFRDKLDVLHDALHRFGQHEAGCDAAFGCACGLATAIRVASVSYRERPDLLKNSPTDS